jgi:hypothetical protein
MTPCRLVFGGLCFLTFCGRLAGYLLFYISKLLRTGILFTALFPNFLSRCRFVDCTDVVLGTEWTLPVHRLQPVCDAKKRSAGG